MPWTSVAKPTASIFGNVNPVGKEQYDQANLTYDSASTFYDGVNPNFYTNVSKPTSSVWTLVTKPS